MASRAESVGAAAARPAAPIPGALAAGLANLKLKLPQVGWWLCSVGLFVGFWELAWAVGWADPLLLPPPHIFMDDLLGQAKNFSTSDRWVIGQQQVAPPHPARAVGTTILATTGRVLSGLVLAFVIGVVAGIAIRYWRLFGNLTLPTITLLAPVSPVAWLPVAIFLFGIGNKPAVFMVFIALFFTMVLATVAQIDAVQTTYLQVARIMGASKRQLYRFVIVPAILPNLFITLRMHLFAAWMVVLIAEVVGVGSGLGQVIMLARNTFNPGLVFFTIAIIGVTGFLFDILLRQVQNRVLWWVPQKAGL
jgi:NitT/TauT family transport system permease protein